MYVIINVSIGISIVYIAENSYHLSVTVHLTFNNVSTILNLCMN